MNDWEKLQNGLLYNDVAPEPVSYTHLFLNNYLSIEMLCALRDTEEWRYVR